MIMDDRNLQIHSIIAIHTLHEEMPDMAWQFFKGVHIMLTIVALLTNTVSLIVISGFVSKITSPLQFLQSVGFANMLASWAAVTVYFPHTSCQEEIQTLLLLISHNVTALTLLGYTAALYIATFKPLHYDKIVTAKKVWLYILLAWITSALLGSLHFIITLIDHDHDSLFCTQVYSNTSISIAVSGLIYVIALLGALACYTKITVYLRPLDALHAEAIMPRKSMQGVITGIILVTFFLLVWPPYLISTFQHLKVHNTKEGLGAVLAMFISIVFILLNCSCNPIIYGIRMETVLFGYSRLIDKMRNVLIHSWMKIKNAQDRLSEDQISSPLNPIESIC